MKKGLFVVLIFEIIIMAFLYFSYPELSKILISSYFYFALVFISFLLFFRSFYLKLDSSLYSGSLILFVGIVGIIQNVKLINIPFYTSLYVFSLCYASLMVFFFFRQNIHLKLFAIVFALVIILFMYETAFITFNLFLTFLFLYLLFVFVMINYVLKKNQRRT